MTKELAKLNIGKTPGDTTSPVLPVLEHAGIQSAICPPCAMCSLPAVMVCSGYRSSSYCSASCRAEDWPAHQLLCRAFGEVLVRPSPRPLGRSSSDAPSSFLPWRRDRCSSGSSVCSNLAGIGTTRRATSWASTDRCGTRSSSSEI